GQPSSDAKRGWPKVSHLRDGTTVSVGKDGRVIQRGRGGQIVSDSSFESYAVYERWVTFMASFQAALKDDDRGRIASSIEYPLRWSGGMISGRGQLLTRYPSVFQPAVVKAVLAADPRALFCKNISEVMLNSGVIWGDDFNGRLAIVTVNPPVP